MSDFLFNFHSGWRYLVLIGGVATLAAALLGARGGTLGAGALRAIRLFAVVLDIQLVVGVVLLFVRPFHPMYIGHIVLMVAAVALAHLLVVTLKRRPPERRTPGLAATGVGICLALMIAGILAIGRPLL